jgi:hypothetical protein
VKVSDVRRKRVHERPKFQRNKTPAHFAALLLRIANKVEAAYRRGDLFAKRVALMSDWAKFCTHDARKDRGQIVSIRSQG